MDIIYRFTGFSALTHRCLRTLPFISLLLLSACVISPDKQRSTPDIDHDLLLTLPEKPISFQGVVKPILERRCVVCHGCYDAPCQLKLSSIEGVRRGSSKEKVYNKRPRPMQPSRLFIDANSTVEWRQRGFSPMLNEQASSAKDNLSNSLLYRLLQQKQLHPQPRVGRLPKDIELDIDREMLCPTLDEYDDKFAQPHPLWGMPYAMPNLKNEEYRTLVQWIAQGSPAEAPAQPSAEAMAQLEEWETFLNGSSNKQQLVSRYLYEHLFSAHIHFDTTPAREFFRLVRSHTPPGQPIHEIPTNRPYEDPGPAPFYYRLHFIHSTIVAKNHLVYQWSKQRMARYKSLFIKPDYAVEELPSYDAKTASNPLISFAAIPQKSRYRFLLDDARFFIEGFTKGPVCRGQVALSVIEDRFWVFFVDPDMDVATSDPAFIEQMSSDLQIPSEKGNDAKILQLWTKYWKQQKRYMAAKATAFKGMQSHTLDQAMEYIWDGDGSNPNAGLTVFRHFDSGSVRFGLLGDQPETAWVIDYPLLERIHYLLVAGFDVYGDLSHQLTTRIFMDFLRMEGENHFLAFLPAAQRKAVRDSWYVGTHETIGKRFEAPLDWLQIEVVTGYQTDDPQRELYQQIEQRLSPLFKTGDPLNRCRSQSCLPESASSDERRVEPSLRLLAQMQGEKLEPLPDVTFLQIETPLERPDLAYSLIRDKAYKHVTSIFQNSKNRNPADIKQDRLTVLKGLEGAYPNFFFRVPLEQFDAFAKQLSEINSEEEYLAFVGRYGYRRTNQQFWQMADWFQDRLQQEQPLKSGLYDLNRYQDP